MFGLSFGAKKGSQTTTSNVNKTETQNQTQTGTQATSGTTTNVGSTTTSQQGQSTGQTTSQQATTGSQQSTQTGTQFSAPVLSALEQSTQALLQSVSPTQQKLDTGFNSTNFVNAGLDAAKSQVNSQLEDALNSIYDNIGGRDNQNSMVTLLANKARGEAGSALSGDYANLVAQANDIQRQNFSANVGAQSAQNQTIDAILAALKGGTTTNTGNVQTAENTTGSGTTAQQQSQTGQQNTSNVQVQDLITAIQQALQGTTTTVGSETDKTKNSSAGGGLSIGL